MDKKIGPLCGASSFIFRVWDGRVYQKREQGSGRAPNQKIAQGSRRGRLVCLVIRWTLARNESRFSVLITLVDEVRRKTIAGLVLSVFASRSRPVTLGVPDPSPRKLASCVSASCLSCLSCDAHASFTGRIHFRSVWLPAHFHDPIRRVFRACEIRRGIVGRGRTASAGSDGNVNYVDGT